MAVSELALFIIVVKFLQQSAETCAVKVHGVKFTGSLDFEKNIKEGTNNKKSSDFLKIYDLHFEVLNRAEWLFGGFKI